MKIKLLTATLAAMLCLTACGDADTKTSSESKADTTTTAATEEVTTEAVTEEVTTETTPAVETTVTTTTEATTTTEEIPPEPAKEEFKLAEGLSEKYVDFDNLALECNGHILRFEEATVQDFLDAGVELFSDDLDKEKADEVEAQVKITDSLRATLTFEKLHGGSSSPRDFILDRLDVDIVESFYFDVTWGPNYGDGMVHFNIPLVLTVEELIENSGEPLVLRNGATSDVKVCEYEGHSALKPDDSTYCSDITIIFVNDNIAEFTIEAHVYDRD